MVHEANRLALELRIGRPRLTLSAAFILVLAVYNFATYTVTTSNQSTLNIPPGDYYQIAVELSPSDTVSGQFNETSGLPVSFYIFSSARYADFQNGGALNSLYAVTDSRASPVSYTVQTQDTYYLVFRHSAAFLNSIQTVYFQRSYTTADSLRFNLGVIFLIFGALELALALRPVKHKPGEVEPDSAHSPDIPPGEQIANP